MGCVQSKGSAVNGTGGGREAEVDVDDGDDEEEDSEGTREGGRGVDSGAKSRGDARKGVVRCDVSSSREVFFRGWRSRAGSIMASVWYREGKRRVIRNCGAGPESREGDFW